MEEKINPTKKKIILSKVFCWPPVVDWLSSLNSSNPQIVLTWGPVSGWVEWVRRFHKYPVILTLNGQKRITPKVCLTSEHKYCHNHQTCVPRGFSTVQLANQYRFVSFTLLSFNYCLRIRPRSPKSYSSSHSFTNIKRNIY